MAWTDASMSTDEPLEAAGRRIGVAWRELRRLAAAQPIRRQLYGFETPLDQGQGDALEYVATQGPCRMGDLAKFMRVDPSSVTRAVERLETAGLVARAVDQHDARAVQVSCTDGGLTVYREGRERAIGLLDRALADFTEEHQLLLAELMERLVGAIEKMADTGDRQAPS